MKKSILLSILSFLAFSASAQDLGSWNVYSSYSTVNSISTSDDGSIFSSTLGGIFIARNGEIVSQLTTINGMHRLDSSHSVYLESSKELILAYPDGVIDILDTESLTFRKLEDISRVDQFPSKQINDMILNGSNLYIATDFGIVVFQLDGFFVSSSFLKLGSFDRGIQVNDIDIEGDSLYAATQQGIAVANLNDNLLEESVWTNYSESNGLPSEIVDDVVAFNNTVYSNSDGIVFSRNGTDWELDNIFGSGEVLGFEKSAEQLGVLFSTKIVLESSSGTLETIFFSNETSVTTMHLNETDILAGTLEEGLYIINNSNTEERDQILPDGPYLNFFSELNYVGNTLVSTSTAAFPQADPFNPVRGYYLFKDGIWSSYNIRTSEALNTAGLGGVFSSSSTSSDYYFGAWGRGVVKHNIETNEISVFNNSNSGFRGINDSRSFVVISGLDNDSNDNMWAISYDSDKPLNLQQNGSDDWFHFNKAQLPTDNLYFNLFIDSNDQKWISLVDFSNNGKGLLVLDTKDISDPIDDVFRKLTSNSNNGNLPDELITEIIEDKNGEVWIGTARGIARFIFPDFITESTNPNDYQAQWLVNEDTSAISRFLLRDVNVSTIAVNQANQKWIGSVNQGLWLLNEEGSRIEKRFTKDNSPLISDNILSITVNDETGEVFIATDLGLVSFRDVPILPRNKMDELKVFPNPFSYDQHTQIVVEGLSEETLVKVLGVDGTVVQELETRGGRVSWDGLDYRGNRLGTGVYFIVSTEKDGNEKGIGKVVIIK